MPKMPIITKKNTIIFAVLLAVSIISQFAALKKTDLAEMQITATFYPLAEFARQIGGDKAQVKTMVPAGMEPHDYEPTPKNFANLKDADIFIFNGAGLDPWAERVLPDLAGVETINASEYVALLPQDPHFWLDPVFSQQIVKIISQKIIKLDPDNSSYYEDNAESFIKKLSELDEKFKTISNCPKKDIITSHSAFAYLANRYKINQIPIAETPEQEPSPGQMARISELVREKSIKYIFFETLTGQRISETIARETGSSILALNPIEGLTLEDEEQGENYISIMEKNLDNLKNSLECKQ